MQALIKILAILVELISALVIRREAAKRDEEIKAIQNDPAGEFINEFGGVPGATDKDRVSSGQAGAPISPKE